MSTNDMILSRNVNMEGGVRKNMNILVLGAPGTGKTRGHVIPNLLTSEFSSIVLDPKGEIYDLTSERMKRRGFRIKMVDFENPKNTLNHYNPFTYCHSEDDIMKIGFALVNESCSGVTDSAFWENTAAMLVNALVGYLKYGTNYARGGIPTKANLESLMELAAMVPTEQSRYNRKSALEETMDNWEDFVEDAWAVRQFRAVTAAAEKTMKSIVITLNSAFAQTMTPEICKLTSYDDLDLPSIGREKTVLYVKSSDVDRSKDVLVSLLFEQVFQELFFEADRRKDTHALPVHTHFFLDDVGTNLNIKDLDKKLAACRGREISASVILQSIGQIQKIYREGYTAITNSCDAMLFLGGNDILTCRDISERLDVPLRTVLEKPKDKAYIFIQGKKAVEDKIMDCEEMLTSEDKYTDNEGR